MEGLAEPEAFKACYAQFRQSDNDRDVLITQLLSNYEDLQIRYRNVMNQLQDEKENREIWQRQTRDARKQLTQSKLANVSTGFSPCTSLPPFHRIHIFAAELLPAGLPLPESSSLPHSPLASPISPRGISSILICR